MDRASNQEGLRIEAAGDGTEFFRDAHGWNVGQIHIANHSADSTSLVSMLRPIHDASHTRNCVLSPPNSRCLPGTRELVFKKIHSWINSTLLFNNPHIMWIHGYAGCGKSAIAQVIAEDMSSQGRLAGSFFFFRGAGDRSKAARLATTIASQLAASIPATAPVIKTAIHATPGLLSTRTATLAAQFQHLIYDPINEVKREHFAASLFRSTSLIVLDGVDECDDREEISNLIEHMIQFFDTNPRTPLRFLITSRVESHIYQRLHSSKQVTLLNLVQHTSDADISTALDVAIDDAKRGLPFAFELSWPSNEARLKLVEHIGGSYIFMTTIIRSLFDLSIADGLTPMERLPRLLTMRPDFDQLYRSTLQAAQGLPHFHAIVSTVALVLEPLSITQIADLLEMKPFAVATVLTELHSIMQVPGDDLTAVTIWHTSLRDFLCSEDRSGCFFASPMHHRRLAYRCISLCGCSLHSERTPALQYSQRFALEHWTRFLHFIASGVEGLNAELDRSMTFLQEAFPGQMDTDFHSQLLDTILRHGQKDRGIHARVKTQGADWSALEIAIRVENWEGLGILLEMGVDVNRHFQDGATALEALAEGEKWDGLSTLLGLGPDAWNRPFRDGRFVFEALTLSSEIRDRIQLQLGGEAVDLNGLAADGRTMLEVACLAEEWKLVRALVIANADINVRFQGEAP
ncbi:hypothetical protein FA13DRAFT_1150181 [Coprinellus micaceus]|uniref:Nephrocystin 3-like N-terminal domain-containing protein n=1 Tax=Coprinellus micaceus TaxID=71717 RepID=A0A4Y7SUW7_COPMI|nr:hypothetical protein FA13DRAFT_1150181 [Coprinellus micaceus]